MSTHGSAGKLHWFPLVEFACVAVSGILWVVFPQIGWWLLLLVFWPWAIRLAIGQAPFLETQFDILLWLFLLTAAIGVWATYDRETAWEKFWIILSSVLLFYAIARQPIAHRRLFFLIIGVFAGCLGLLFVITQDWQAQPVDFGFIRKLGAWWESIRPNISVGIIPPNLAGGLIAMTILFPLAWGIDALRQRNWVGAGSAMGLVGLAGLGLLITSSRGAWVALFAGALTWFVWAFSRNLSQRYRLSRWFVLVFCLVAGLGLVLGLTFIYPGGILGLADRLPGVASGASRVELAGNTLDLIHEYPYTGGGLGAFPGLYSHYVKLIPNFLFGYSHNMYLDVALEQGIPGLLLFLSVFLGGLWLLVGKDGGTSEQENIGFLKGALIGSLCVVLVHGLIDDAIYGNRATPLIFLLPAMAVLLSRSPKRIGEVVDKNLAIDERNIEVPGKIRLRQKFSLLVLGLLFLGMIILPWHRQLRASWYANLGSIKMAQAEMVKFPSESWEDMYQTDYPSQVEELFEKALRLNPTNQTANYRLGLIALARRDFPGAVISLEAALRGGSTHRGIRKALGYAYTWTGDFDGALNLLKDFPESPSEMDTYVWWWQTKGREDLANNSGMMMKLLASNNLMNGTWNSHD